MHSHFITYFDVIKLIYQADIFAKRSHFNDTIIVVFVSISYSLILLVQSPSQSMQRKRATDCD